MGRDFKNQKEIEKMITDFQRDDNIRDYLINSLEPPQNSQQDNNNNLIKSPSLSNFDTYKPYVMSTIEKIYSSALIEEDFIYDPVQNENESYNKYGSQRNYGSIKDYGPLNNHSLLAPESNLEHENKKSIFHESNPFYVPNKSYVREYNEPTKPIPIIKKDGHKNLNRFILDSVHMDEKSIPLEIESDSDEDTIIINDIQDNIDICHDKDIHITKITERIHNDILTIINDLSTKLENAPEKKETQMKQIKPIKPMKPDITMRTKSRLRTSVTGYSSRYRRPLPPLPPLPPLSLPRSLSPTPSISSLFPTKNGEKMESTKVFTEERRSRLLSRHKDRFLNGRRYITLINPLFALSDSGEFACPSCVLSFNTEVSFNDHFLATHMSQNINEDNNECVCDNCGQAFDDSDDLDDHVEECGIIDNIPVNLLGVYSCPACDNKYVTAGMLGEHFIITHNNYSDMSILDTKKKEGGFPGFDMLNLINMIYSGPIITEQTILKNDVCYICRYDYKEKQEPLLPSRPIKMTRRSSDSSLAPYKKNHVDGNTYEHIYNKKPQPDLIINDHQLITEINKVRESEVIPCMMMCCDRSICKQCIKRHIMSTNKIRCPFCDHDHESDGDYVTVIEENEEYNTRSWDMWWENNMQLLKSKKFV